jgi:site-specific DNA recombinase
MAEPSSRGYIDQITALTNKNTRARELLLNGDIDSADYREIKNETESAIRILETKISELSDFLPSSEFNSLVDKFISTITKIDVICCKSDSDTKRKLISSMCPEKITLENLKFRTNKLSESFEVICLIKNKLLGKKARQLTQI